MNIFEVSLTNYCNFKCSYCISDGSRGCDKFSEPLKLNEDGTLRIHPEGMAQADYDRLKDTAHDSGDWIDLSKLLEFIRANLSPDWVVNLTGGEPLYYPSLGNFIVELVKTHKVVITTNLSLIKNHKQLLNVDRSSLFFRVGYHPEFRSMSEFTRNMDYLIESGFNYIINYVLHPKYHIDSDQYEKHLKVLNNNQYQYEVTPFEGEYLRIKYPRPAGKRSDVEKLLLSEHQQSEFTTSPMGNHFLLAEPNGKVFECQGKNAELGDVYKNRIRFTNQPMFHCFNGGGCSPAKSANNYLKIFLGSSLDSGK